MRKCVAGCGLLSGIFVVGTSSSLHHLSVWIPWPIAFAKRRFMMNPDVLASSFFISQFCFERCILVSLSEFARPNSTTALIRPPKLLLPFSYIISLGESVTTDTPASTIDVKSFMADHPSSRESRSQILDDEHGPFDDAIGLNVRQEIAETPGQAMLAAEGALATIRERRVQIKLRIAIAQAFAGRFDGGCCHRLLLAVAEVG